MAWKQQTRLMLPTLVVCVILVLLTGVAAWTLHQLQREYSRHLVQCIARVQAADELMRNHERTRMSLDQFLLTDESSEPALMPDLNREADDWIARMDELAFSDQGRDMVQQVRVGHAHFEAETSELLSHQPSVEQRPAVMADLNRIFEEEILQPARQYQRFSRDRLQQLSLDDRSFTDRQGWALWLLGIFGALAGLLAGFAVARNVERKLVQQQNAMTRSEQLATLGRIAAALAHELRNPLTSLRIIAQTASPADDRVSLDQADFSILEREIERLDSSIQTFLDYARPPRPEKRPCVLQLLVRETVSLVERRAALLGVGICDDLPIQPITVEVDPAQLKQIFLNLLLNALDASPNGGTVTLQAGVSSCNGSNVSDSRFVHGAEFVELKLADTGTGLPESLGDRIFDAFVSTKETGTGLGLAICKRIIEDHGGEIGARNGPGRGAVFFVRLPRVQRREADSKPQAASRLLH